MAILKFVNEAGEDDLVHVGWDRPKVLIGRSKECHLKTKNNTVSRLHAAVTFRDGRYFLQDLGSANGTFYRRQRVTEVALEDGEILFCGTFQIEFRLDDRDRMPMPGKPGTGARVVAAEETDSGPPPLPAKRIPPVVQGAPQASSAPTAAPPPQDAPQVFARTFAYETPAVSDGQGPLLAEEIEDVTFAVEEDGQAQRPADVVGLGTVGPGAKASEPVKFREEAPLAEMERILKEDRERVAREEAAQAENARLQAEVRKRDEVIRLLKVQVEELGKVVARYEAAQADRDSELRVADLERVLQATEAERARIEEDLEAHKSLLEQARLQAREQAERVAALAGEVEAVRAERDDLAAQVQALSAEVAEKTLRADELARDAEEARRLAEREAASAKDAARAADRIAALEREVAIARSEAEVSALAVKRLETERAALEEETQRWEALKRQFEEERTEARVEIEGLRGQVAELTARLADASGAAERALALEEQLKAMSKELGEVKAANRSYLKKISRLLEEAEQARAVLGAGTSGELEALKGENRRLVGEVSRLQAELAASRDQVKRLTERVMAFESPSTGPQGLAGLDLNAIRCVLDRVNDLISEGRTNLDVVMGLVWELAERFAGTPETGEMVTQIRASAEDLARAIQMLKKEAVQARNLIKLGVK